MIEERKNTSSQTREDYQKFIKGGIFFETIRNNTQEALRRAIK